MYSKRSEPQYNSGFTGVLIRARAMAYEGAAGRDLADLLDTAEMLPRFIASETLIQRPVLDEFE